MSRISASTRTSTSPANCRTSTASLPPRSVWHACAHDLHTSMLVGAARVLAARRDQLAGDVVLMFQPGEEDGGGAGIMISEGVLDAAGRRPDAAWALHAMSGLTAHGTVLSRRG